MWERKGRGGGHTRQGKEFPAGPTVVLATVCHPEWASRRREHCAERGTPRSDSVGSRAPLRLPLTPRRPEEPTTCWQFPTVPGTRGLCRSRAPSRQLPRGRG